MKREVLIIDDNQGSDGLEHFLKTKDYFPVVVDNVDKGLVKIEESENLKVALLNVELSGINGLEALKKIKDRYSDVIVIVIRAEVNTTRKAMRFGALDVMSKYANMEDIHRVLDLVFRRLSIRNETALIPEIKMPEEQDSLVGESRPMFEVNKEIGRVADNKISVLIEGETGTGKWLVARLIHKESGRAKKPFILIDCGALPDKLLEGELFGYVKGAYTDADPKGKPGQFEEADGGTLFLDEVSNMTPQLQKKLLTVLQTGNFSRVGETKVRKVDVRVISATNENLEQLVEEGKFREDLYHRLCGYQISLPPLRERVEDIPLLVAYFLQRIKKENGTQMYGVSKKVMRLFEAYNWPGNVRELENYLKRAAINSQDDVILLNDLPQTIWDGGSDGGVPEMPETPLYENLLDLPVAVFCQLLSDRRSDITGSQIIEWWKVFANDGSARAHKAKREIDDWLVEWHTSWLTFPKLSERIQEVIDAAVSVLSDLRDEAGSKLIEEVEPISIKGRTLNSSLAAVLREVVKAHGENKEKAVKELGIDLEELEKWLSYPTEDDGNDATDSFSTSTRTSRSLELIPNNVIKRLLIEPIKFFVLDPFFQNEWEEKAPEDQIRIVHLDLKVLSKRLRGSHGCIYFGGMTFKQIKRNIYRRAPYIYDDHDQAAEALGKDVRTFERRWPKEKEFPTDHTLLVG
ncbi:sigma-54-dependent Fis family transcriptional regulator [Candidatus Poribacteria bacterium]|nr:sigma-54-dependent Fis family transcriptional regulator [Candidatus Poribacteria bacterium]